MSDTAPAGAGPPAGPPPSSPSSSSSSSGPGRWQRWSVLLPALTFLVGLALGAAVVGVTTTADEGIEGPAALESPSPSAPVEPSASPGDLTLTVPAPCVEAAEKAELAFEVLQDAAGAVRDLDARRLADVVDLAQAEQAEVERLVDQCQAVAGTRLLEPVPTASS